MTGTRRTTHDTGGFDAYIADAIDGAHGRVWLKVPWFAAEHAPAKPILDALVRAVSRHDTDVRVILRPEASNTVTLQKLARTNVPTRTQRYLHEKELLVDDRLITFSANFTQAELRRNTNTSYEITDPADRSAAEDAFLEAWQTDAAEGSAGEEAFVAADKVVPPRLVPLLGRLRLNPLQAMALPVVFGSDRSVVVTAPTGSGKTMIGEAALLKSTVLNARKAVYITPARALTKELGGSFDRWQAAGVGVVTLSGDVDVDASRINRSDIWVSTTEKFEGLFRRASMARAIADVGCVVVDEIHFLGTEKRGPLLEALLARLRLLSARTRLVGLSATVTNADDLAAWLDAALLRSSWRPIQLTTQVLGYPAAGKWLEDERSKDELARPIIEDITGAGGQVISFCGSKPKARRAAAALAGIPDSGDDDDVGERALEGGVGLHFRGISVLREAERRFRAREIRTLVATSTLAQGVNLPARAVIIRDTTLGQDALTVGDALQMAGRAGRAGQDAEGFAFLIAPDGEVASWRNQLLEGHAVHSKLGQHLGDHILAEVLLGQITSAAHLRSWFSGTFAAWEAGGTDPVDLLDRALGVLINARMVEVGEDGDSLSCTPLGALTSRFLVDIESAAALLRAIDSVPVPSSAAEAEALVLIATAVAIDGFASAYVTPTAIVPAMALLPTSIVTRLNNPPPGSVKTLCALLAAIRNPTSLGSGKYGPFSVSELRDLADDAPRYLTWLGATGRIGRVDWVAPVSADLAARIQWRAVRPQRGSGRLLRALERRIPAEERQRRIPSMFSRLQGQHDPLALVATESSVSSLNVRLRLVELSGSVEFRDGDLHVEIAANDDALPLRLFARAHAGPSPTVASVDQWQGGPVGMPRPAGTTDEIAVDVLAFGEFDWAWWGSTLHVPTETDDGLARFRTIIGQFDDGLLVLPRKRLVESRKRWLARVVGGIVNRPKSQELESLAAALAGAGTSHERAWRLIERLRALVSMTTSLGDGQLAAPTATLRAGEADSSSWGLCAAVLASAAVLDIAVVTNQRGDLRAAVMLDEHWRVVATADDSAFEALVPAGLAAEIGRLSAPPEVPPPPAPAPVWSFLADFREPGGDDDFDGLVSPAPPASSTHAAAVSRPYSAASPATDPSNGDDTDGQARFNAPSTLSASQRDTIERQQPGLLSRYPRAYSTWSIAEDDHLRRLHQRGLSVGQLSELHERHPGSIRSRLNRLELS